MSKITLALGSFTVGLLLGSLFLGSHTITFAQTPSSPPTSPPTPRKYPFVDMTIDATTSKAPAVEMGKEPSVPGLGPPFLRLHVKGGQQALDGLDCDDCEFTGGTLLYSGGAVRLGNPTFNGIVRVELVGPAANTAALLPLLLSITAKQKPQTFAPNRPVLKTINLTTPAKLDIWQTPYQK